MSQNESNFVYVVPHTHWDREWYLSFEAFRMRLVKLLDRLCDNLDSDPLDSFHLDGQTIVLEDYEEIRGRSERLRRLVKEGRIQIGPWYVQPDEFLPSGEALIRNIQRGFRIAREWGAAPCMIGYMPDMFGHTGQMPQILNGFGIRRAVVWRGVPPSIARCGFRWQAPDSTEVFSCFLPMGYGVGFNLPNDPVGLRGRIIFTRVLMSRFIEGPSWLLTAGNDHQQPRKGMPELLKKAFDGQAGWGQKVATLSEFLDKLETESKDKPIAVGELRDSHYAPVIQAVGSARLYLKKHDFEVSSLLERYAEPLAAWVWALGGADPRDFLNHAWKLLFQNQPHDSICGCSVDEVHQAMMPRYLQAETVARRVLRNACVDLGKMLNPKAGKWFAVWKPAGDNSATPVIFEMDGKAAKHSALEEPDGTIIPLQTLEEIEPGIIMGGADVPAIASSMALAFMFQEEEMFGGYIVDVDTKKDGNALKVSVGIGNSPRGLDIERIQTEIQDEISKSGVAVLKVSARKEPAMRMAAVIPGLKPFSLSAFKLVKASDEFKSDLKSEENVIENSYWRVVANNDGSLTIHDRRNDTIIKNAMKYVDEGDCGDEYNFGNIIDDKRIDEPVKTRIRKLYDGPVAAGMRIEAIYKIPEGLDKTDKNRSKRLIPLQIDTDVVLYNSVRWIDFRAKFVNNVRDHRLRVLFEAPFKANELFCETAFAVMKRKSNVIVKPPQRDPSNPISLLIGPESEVGHGMHRGFAALESGKMGIALFNRGLPEIEAIEGREGTALALTLIRAVKTISRDDIYTRIGHAGPPILTPDAQCPGEHTCEFAFTTYEGSWQDAVLPALAHSWRHPPYMFRISGGKGALVPQDAPITSDNPAIEIRALQPAPDGSEALCARIYNTTEKPQKGRLQFHSCFKKCAESDLMGKIMGDIHIRREEDHSLIIELPPARITTLRLEM